MATATAVCLNSKTSKPTFRRIGALGAATSAFERAVPCVCRTGATTARDPGRVRDRVLVKPARVLPLVWRAQPARPGAAVCHRRQACQSRHDRDRHRRRRRRLRHWRTISSRPCGATSTSPHRHGQRDLRPDHRAGLPTSETGMVTKPLRTATWSKCSTRWRWRWRAAAVMLRAIRGQPKHLLKLYTEAIQHFPALRSLMSSARA